MEAKAVAIIKLFSYHTVCSGNLLKSNLPKSVAIVEKMWPYFCTHVNFLSQSPLLRKCGLILSDDVQKFPSC